MFLDLLWTDVNSWRSCTWTCCEQLWTAGKLYLDLPWTTVNSCGQLWTDGEALPVSAVDSCELMEKLYLYLLWTAVNWWRSFTCICCGQLGTDEEALPVYVVDSYELMEKLYLYPALWNRNYFFTVPVPVPTFEKLWFRFRFLLLKKLWFRFRFLLSKSYGSSSGSSSISRP